MTREIKFRAWNKNTKKMVDLYKITPFAVDSRLEQDGLFIPFSKDIELMQFTGLIDKNGKEIWEGDIVKSLTPSYDCVAKVVWNEGGFWSYEDLDGGLDSSVVLGESLYNYQFEVIGNVYMNPELLEKLNQ